LVRYTCSYSTYRLETCSLPETAHFESVTSITRKLRGCTQDRSCPGLDARIRFWLPRSHGKHMYTNTRRSIRSYLLMSVWTWFLCIDQWFPKCAPRIPRDIRPIPRRSVGTLLF